MVVQSIQWLPPKKDIETEWKSPMISTNYKYFPTKIIKQKK